MPILETRKHWLYSSCNCCECTRITQHKCNSSRENLLLYLIKTFMFIKIIQIFILIILSFKLSSSWTCNLTFLQPIWNGWFKQQGKIKKPESSNVIHLNQALLSCTLVYESRCCIAHLASSFPCFGPDRIYQHFACDSNKTWCLMFSHILKAT